jgi:acyl carrier protein
MSIETVQSLTDYITAEILKQPGRALSPDASLITSGLVDSFSLVDLAMFVEEQFGVKIDDTELNAQSFDTVNELAAMVESRR